MQQDINALNSGPGAAQLPSGPFSMPRSNYWPNVKNAHLAKHPVCAACLAQGDAPLQVVPQVHHIIPFQYCVYLGRPELEFHPNNLMTLCEGSGTNDHHIAIGHLGNFQHLNEAVVQDVAGPWKGLLKTAIEKLTDWIHRERWPQKPLTDQEKARLLALMTSQCGEQPSGSVEALIALWWGESVPGTSTATTIPPSPATGA